LLFRFLLRAILASALAAQLAACLEPVGRPGYMKTPAASPTDLCKASTQSPDSVNAYKCAKKQ
jgi:hypothetical protein